ncbi:pygopus homolog 1 [Spea bombifrons]|uniref:pygopus homolog 1 n=1 Tax=Spea bombifrons TaxID=233779 RepID=UPI002349F0FD|nr:pygopus homolog 1 [Spea bombifrons]
MSAEQGKEPYKRAGAVENDGSLRHSVQFGSPEKKKRKSSTQPPRSEYAPPANTSSDHLVASNPFDDDYNTPLGYNVFGNARYAATEAYSAFSMPPTMSPRTSSRFAALHALRGNLPHFPQDGLEKPFGRILPFNLALQENPYYSGLSETITFPGQHFISNRTESSQNVTRRHPNPTDVNFAPHRGLGNQPNVNLPLETSLTSICNSRDPKTYSLKHDFSPVKGRNWTPNSTALYLQQHSKDGMHSTAGTNNHQKSPVPGTERSHSTSSEPSYANDIERGPETLSASKLAKADVTASEKCNRWLLHSSYCGHLPTVPLYPCGICSGDVIGVQDAIMCKASCQKWFHRTCTGMTEIAFAFLTAETSAIWGCDSCMAKKDMKLVRVQKSMS